MRVVSAHERGRGLAVKFALVLLCVVVLELVLIGDRAQSVKGLKKKIYLKKLKKILPFLALVRPKKKLILVPIPIPMYNEPPHAPNYQGQTHEHTHTTNGDGSSPPVSFMMMTEPNVIIDRPPPSQMSGGGFFESTAMSSMMMPSMTMTIQSDGSGTMSAIDLTGPSGRPAATPAPQLVPAPVMSSALLPSNNTVSGALLAGQPSKWPDQQQQVLVQQYDYDLDEQFLDAGNQLINESRPPSTTPQQAAAGGEHYYSSPWQSNRRPPPLASPARYLRKERLQQQHQQQQQQQQQQRPVAAETVQSKSRRQRNQQTITANPMSRRLTDQQKRQRQHQHQRPSKQPQRFSAPMPVLIVKNQWHPSAPVVQQSQWQASGKSAHRQSERAQQERHLAEPRGMPQLTREQEQQISQALEQESLVQVGPTQMLPIYQSPSGRLSMTPPTPPPLPSSFSGPTSTTTVGSVATGDTAASNSLDHYETPAPITHQDANAEVQTVGSPSGSSTFFSSPAVGDSPTEYSTSVGSALLTELSFDGQHAGSESTTTTTTSSSGRELGENATGPSQVRTAASTTGRSVSSARLVAPAIKGDRIQSAAPPQQPIGAGTKNTAEPPPATV